MVACAVCGVRCAVLVCRLVACAMWGVRFAVLAWRMVAYGGVWRRMAARGGVWRARCAVLTSRMVGPGHLNVALSPSDRLPSPPLFRASSDRLPSPPLIPYQGEEVLNSSSRVEWPLLGLSPSGAAGDVLQDEGAEEPDGDYLSLVYDPTLMCYYERNTGRYYKLKGDNGDLHATFMSAPRVEDDDDGEAPPDARQ